MDFLFGWLPMPSGLDQESWEGFLANFSAVFLVLLVVTVAVTVLGYRKSANSRRIYRPSDVFSGYTPFKWLWAALGGAVVTAIVCAFMYKSATDTYSGVFPTCSEFFLIMLVLALGISYLMIALAPWLTPRRFKYRAAPFLHGRGANGRGDDSASVIAPKARIDSQVISRG